MAELHQLVGQITATWAEVEDGLFNTFVVTVAGTSLVDDQRPYRAVFFTFSSYEGKMRMTRNALRARFGENEQIMAEWKVIAHSLDQFAALRNKIAHLIPKARSSTDPTAIANVRLVPAFWRGLHQNELDFNISGFSLDELWQALGPFWGYHPRVHGLNPPSGEAAYQLGYRLQEFAKKLSPPPPQLKVGEPGP